MTKTNDKGELITTKQAAAKLGISENRIRQLIQQERLPAQLLGNSYVINSIDLKLVEVRKPGRPPKAKDAGK